MTDAGSLGDSTLAVFPSVRGGAASIGPNGVLRSTRVKMLGPPQTSHRSPAVHALPPAMPASRHSQQSTSCTTGGANSARLRRTATTLSTTFDISAAGGDFFGGEVTGLVPGGRARNRRRRQFLNSETVRCPLSCGRPPGCLPGDRDGSEVSHRPRKGSDLRLGRLARCNTRISSSFERSPRASSFDFAHRPS